VNKFILLLLYINTPLFLLAQYKADSSKSTIMFKIKNLGINVEGLFRGMEGTISFEPGHPEKASFKASVNVNSINTGNDFRDSHLKKESYFDTERYPRIIFESTRIVPTAKKDAWLMLGKLTMKDHPKEVSFPFTTEETAYGYIFKGTLSINRREFGVGGASILSDNVEIILNVVAVR
jgi:polyisoprenoid-binding protein YceI